MFKKMISILVILAFAVTMLLSGCATKTETRQDASASTASSSTAPVKEEVTAPLKIIILGQDTYNPNWPLSRGLPIIKELEKRTNVELEFQAINVSQLVTTVQTRLAAGTDLPDLVELSGMPVTSLYNLGKQGILLEMGSLMDQYAPNIIKTYQDYPVFKEWITSPDGKMYYFNRIDASETEYYTGVWLRKDWLDKAGIAKLPETTDELFNALKTMQDKDVNGNGKKDEVYLPYQWWQFEWGLPYAFGVASDTWNVGADGKVFFGRLSQGYKQFVQFCNRLYAAGLTDPEIVAMPWDKYFAKMTSNMVMGSVNVPRALTWNKENSNGGNSEIAFLPTLNANSGGVSVKTIWGAGYWGITKDCKNVEGVMKFLDYVYSPECEMLTKYGIEGVHFTKDADGKVIRTQQYLDGLAKDPANYADSLGSLLGGYLPYKYVFTTEDFIITNEEVYKSDKIDPQVLRDVMAMYKKDAIDSYPFISSTEEESKQIDAIGSDWTKYIDEMVVKFFLGKESFDNWDAFVKKANELGAEKVTAVQQTMYDRYKSLKK